MKFETIIKQISAGAASLVVFLISAGMYLSAKGFIMEPNGEIVLVKRANATEIQQLSKPIDKALILPEGNSEGDANAPVILYEFSSFGCYHCADFHLNTLPKLRKDYINQGKLRLVFNDFPLDQKSMKASLMAHCFQGEQYFKFLDTLFKKQREWSMSSDTTEHLMKYAFLHNLNEKDAKICLNNKDVAEQIMDARQYAIKQLGVTGTPSFVIASASGKEIIYGAPDYDSLKSLIDKNLVQK